MNARTVGPAILMIGASLVAAAWAGPLHEIGHDGITNDACGSVVIHANGAIASTLRVDDALDRAIVRLRAGSFDDDSPGKRAAIEEIRTIAATIAGSTSGGIGETVRLGTLADTTPRDHVASLRAFAGDVATALDAQRKAGIALDEFVSAVESRDLRGSSATTAFNTGRAPSTDLGPAALEAMDTTPRFLVRTGAGPMNAGPAAAPRKTENGKQASPTTTARLLAAEIERRLGEIGRAEALAAERARDAVTGC